MNDMVAEFTTPVEPQRRFKLVRFDQIKLPTDPAYLVKGLIPREGLCVVWGPPKCGKSFWIYDAMMHVACGWKYRGRKVNRGAVVYVACEGERGLGARTEPMTTKCLWCDLEFQPRTTGGSAQRFCSAPCRRAFDTACRVYAAREVDAGRLSMSMLRTALEQRARCVERDLGPGYPKVPGEPKTRDAGLHGPSAGKIECRPPAVETLEDTLKRALKSEGSVHLSPAD